MKTPRVYVLTRTALLAAMTCALAFVVIPLPFSPAPITGQSLGVMLAGLLLPPRQAALSQAIYVFLGAVGLPVFAGGTSGPGVLIGPIGGYLWGFIVGAYVISMIADPERTRRRSRGVGYATFAAVVGGVLVVYLLGVIQMVTVTGLTLTRAVIVGVLPFIPGDLLKAFVAGMVGSRSRVLH